MEIVEIHSKTNGWISFIHINLLTFVSTIWMIFIVMKTKKKFFWVQFAFMSNNLEFRSKIFIHFFLMLILNTMENILVHIRKIYYLKTAIYVSSVTLYLDFSSNYTWKKLMGNIHIKQEWTEDMIVPIFSVMKFTPIIW